MARMKQNWGAFVLELIASLVFIATWWSLWASGASSPLFAGAGAFWTPIFVGFAVIASIALFFLSFGNISGGGDAAGMRTMNMWALKATAISGVGLTTWAWASATWAWAAMFGFVLGFLGTWLAWKGM